MAVHVHIDNYAAQTGASLFLQVHTPPHLAFLRPLAQDGWVYNKTENLSARDVTSARHFTHVITEAQVAYADLGWQAVEGVEAFDGIRIRSGAKGGAAVFPLEYVYHEKLWIMERR